MKTGTRINLCIMMFLEFFVWGAWYVPMGVYLGAIDFSPSAIANAYSTVALAAIVSPFFVGMIADRFFAAERVLGIMHLLGGIALLAVSRLVEPGFFFWVLLLYTLTYTPTLALVNAVAFQQLDSIEKQFPAIRVFGTLGWIVAGLLIGFLEVNTGGARWNFVEPFLIPVNFAITLAGGEGDWVSASETSIPMIIAAIAAIILGIYSFFLPHTPPKAKGQTVKVRDILGLDALGLLKDPSFAIFALSSFLICIPLSAYYTFANPFLVEMGMENATAKLTLGQMSEFFFMLVMAFFFARLGVKKMLLVGMLAWVGRYLLFAFGNNDSLMLMYYAGILLHGICYDFFFVTGQIYVDNEAPKEIRANAQGFIGMITYGLGMYVGYILSGKIVEHFQATEGVKWPRVWMVMTIMAFVVSVIFAILFKEKPKAEAATKE
ncbi:MAG TPA: nucleoside permease [Candidatus Hydrogenedentes bacterium]|nr:nucleoside permease [Candidatus Hydrogenedentota bacterium]HQH51814.1 nucleoside permease [Candidatus Hydrogenedentota bacterium]